MTIKDFEDDPSKYIYLQSGSIVYQSIFSDKFNGDLDLLLDCIEDNIFVYESGEDEVEQINYHKAIKDYRESMVRNRCIEKIKHDIKTKITTDKDKKNENKSKQLGFKFE